MSRIATVIKVIIQIITVILPFLKGAKDILEENNLKRKKR